MASVTKADIPEISEFMTNFWNLVKKYWIPEDLDSEYWDDLIGEVDDLYHKYEYPFVKKVLLAFVDYEDDEMRRKFPR